LNLTPKRSANVLLPSMSFPKAACLRAAITIADAMILLYEKGRPVGEPKRPLS